MNNRIEKSALEAMMFTWGEPLEAKSAAAALSIEADEAYDLLMELQKEYEEKCGGIRIRRTGKAFQFVTSNEVGEYVRKLCTPIKKRRLSQSALEVLAIVAYKQPVTRGQIEAIRGIKCERVLEGLANRGLVGEVGRSDGIGRPILYGTTIEFLKYLGLEDLSQLPEIEIDTDAGENDLMGNGLFQQPTLEGLGDVE